MIWKICASCESFVWWVKEQNQLFSLKYVTQMCSVYNENTHMHKDTHTRTHKPETTHNMIFLTFKNYIIHHTDSLSTKTRQEGAR